MIGRSVGGHPVAGQKQQWTRTGDDGNAGQ